MNSIIEELGKISLDNEVWLKYRTCGRMLYFISNKGRFVSIIGINPNRNKRNSWEINIMTREEAKEILPIIQAFAEGKAIEYQNDSGSWTDITKDLYTGNSPSLYRIKPEPRYRPFKTQEECWNEMLKHQPFGWVKSKDKGYFHLIGSVNKDSTITLAIEPNTDYSCTYIFENYMFADHAPFGIKEEQI